MGGVEEEAGTSDEAGPIVQASGGQGGGDGGGVINVELTRRWIVELFRR